MNAENFAESSPDDREPIKVLHDRVLLGGRFPRKPWRVLAELALHVALMLGGLALAVAAHGTFARALGLFVSTAGLLGISTNTHTSSHNGTTQNRPLGKFLTYLGYPFFVGLSATYWYNKHLVIHHPTPNLIGVDDDIDLAPFFAVTDQEIERSRGLRRFWYQRVQRFVIPFAISLNMFNMQRAGWQFLAARLGDRRRRNAGHFADVAALVAHYAVWVGLPMLFFPPGQVVLLYVARFALMGYAIFIAFAPAHFPAEAVVAPASERSADFVLRQTATTVNFRTGLVGRLLCSGVDYQIEHHLFPAVSHVHYPAISRIVEEFCRERGYPYRTLGWGEAVVKSVLAFGRPKRVLPRLELATSAEEVAGAPDLAPASAP